MIFSILLAIVSAIAWGTQAIFLRVTMRDTPLYTTILIVLIINFLAVVVLIGCGKGFSEFCIIPWTTYFYFVVAGFLNYFLGRSLFYSSIRFIGATQATSISSIYPLISVGFAILVLEEKLVIRQFFGIGLTLAGVYLLLLKGKK